MVQDKGPSQTCELEAQDSAPRKLSPDSGPSGAVFGSVVDASCDLFRASGIGPTSKWVDDHFFIRILVSELEGYNQIRKSWAEKVSALGPQNMEGVFGLGIILTLLVALRKTAVFATTWMTSTAYLMKLSKDVPFSSSALYLQWDLDALTVSLPPEMATRYQEAIACWKARSRHNLTEIQELYGKLLQASFVIPEGRAPLTGLETALSIAHRSPFIPRFPPRYVAADLEWWHTRLSSPSNCRSVIIPPELLDLHAFCDARTSAGIDITVGDRWRAWSLHPGWRTRGGKKDIGKAEAIRLYLLPLVPRGSHFCVNCSSDGVVVHPRLAEECLGLTSPPVTPPPVPCRPPRPSREFISDSNHTLFSSSSASSSTENLTIAQGECVRSGQPEADIVDLEFNIFSQPVRLRTVFVAGCLCVTWVKECPCFVTPLHKADIWFWFADVLRLLRYHITKTPPVPESALTLVKLPLLLEFISRCASNYSGSAVKNYVFGVRAWHTLHALPWEIPDDKLSAAPSGAEKLAPGTQTGLTSALQSTPKVSSVTRKRTKRCQLVMIKIALDTYCAGDSFNSGEMGNMLKGPNGSLTLIDFDRAVESKECDLLECPDLDVGTPHD
ncbi:hypothetical protein CVT24_006876 [Panaeolus cyanescens]|uniref:Uncharacterized protein n=1 Tax=Panaeolus cyanescens TaxID=181874 RepID=A0A409WZ55_9AGAR|nr:hypothetical protein CVT24_006876 [Panaeolus cyanescens]